MEVPVEIKKYVNVPFDRIVNKPYDVIKENLVWNEKIIDINENEIQIYN